MLQIKPVKATLGKSVSAKIKNQKDDQARVIEFSLTKLSLTNQQLTELVACNEHERTFAQIAFVSEDQQISELRMFKKLELGGEVFDAVLSLRPVGTRGKSIKLGGCTLKNVNLSFNGSEKCEMSCKVWAPIEEHALFLLSEWSTSELYVGITSTSHGEEEPDDNNVLPFDKSEQ